MEMANTQSKDVSNFLMAWGLWNWKFTRLTRASCIRQAPDDILEESSSVTRASVLPSKACKEARHASHDMPQLKSALSVFVVTFVISWLLQRGHRENDSCTPLGSWCLLWPSSSRDCCSVDIVRTTAAHHWEADDCDEDGKVLCWSLCCVGAELAVEADSILGGHCCLGRFVEVAVLEPLPRGCCCEVTVLEVEAESILGGHCSLGRFVEVSVLEPLPRGCCQVLLLWGHCAGGWSGIHFGRSLLSWMLCGGSCFGATA